MQDEALSGRPRSWIRYWPIVLTVVLAGLYFSATSGIRAYVSYRIESVEGQQVPSFRLLDRAGRRWTERDLRGKVTILNFFRSRCIGCRKERDAIHAVAAEAKETGVQVLSIMMDQVEGYPADADFVAAFHGLGWSHVTPITYIIDAKGVVTNSLRGHQGVETLRAASK
jgi:thiol-disulfide isomerase/thioredoxin